MAVPPPVLRAVVLGASNVRMGFPQLLARLRGGAGGPVEVLAALGHGRSYGMDSRLLWARRLPGILHCGLWNELGRRPPLPTLALVTDVGNDLLYGAAVPAILGWTGAALDRLDRLDAAIVLGLLPIASLEKVSTARFALFRSVLFPGCRVPPWSALLDSARKLNEQLRRQGLAHGARVVEPPPSWYGIDPIHVRRSLRPRVWAELLDDPRLARSVQAPAGRRLPTFGAAELSLFGVPLRIPQPVCRYADGTTVALY